MAKSVRWMIPILAGISLVAVVMAGSPVGVAEELTDILGSIRQNYGSLPGLAVPYSREVITRTMAMMGSQVKGDLATGWIYFKPPHFLRLEQERPTREFLITDGTTLWWFLPDQKQAYRYDQESFGKELKLLSDLFGGLEDAEGRFQLALTSAGEAETKLELRPDPPWEQVDHIVVTLDKGYAIRGVDIHNSLGGITRFHLEPMTERAIFEDGFFRFTAPEGVEVLEGAAR